MSLSYGNVKKNEELKTLLDEILVEKGWRKKGRQLKADRIEEEKRVVQEYLDEVISSYKKKSNKTRVSGGGHGAKKTTRKNKK